MPRPRKANGRSFQLKARFTATELEAVNARAAHTGMTVSDLLRHGVLDNPPPPTRLHRRVQCPEELARLLGQVGRIGNNVNQLARIAHAGSWPDSERITQAVADIQWMRARLMDALGYDPVDSDPPAPVLTP